MWPNLALLKLTHSPSTEYVVSEMTVQTDHRMELDDHSKNEAHIVLHLS